MSGCFRQSAISDEYQFKGTNVQARSGSSQASIKKKTSSNFTPYMKY